MSFLVFCLFVSLLDLGIAASVYLHAPQRPLNRVFGGLGLCSAAWMLAIGLAHDPMTSHVWFVRSTFAAASLLVLALVTFVDVFPRGAFPRTRLYVAYAGVGLALSGLACSPAIVRSSTHGANGLVAVYGVLHPVFSLYALAGVIGSLRLVYVKARRATGHARLELWYLALAVVVPALGIATTNLLVPLVSGVSRHGRYGPAFIVAFLAITAHAVIRHRLMSVRLVVSRTISYLIAAAVAGGAFVGLVWLGHEGLGDVGGLPVGAQVVGLFIGAMAVQPLLHRIRVAVDRYLYRAPYDDRWTLRAASATIASLVELPALLEYLCAVLGDALRPERVAVYLRDAAGGDQRLAMIRVFVSDPEMPLPREIVPGNSPLPAGLGLRLRPVLVDDPSPADSAAAMARAELAMLGGDYAEPIVADQQLLGFVLLGPKLSADPYYKEDVDLVGILVNGASIAIRNAELYREIRAAEADRQRNARLAALGAMASGIAHEVKNPLVAIRTFAELLPERFTDEEFRTDFSRVVLQEIDRIDGLIGQLRGLALASERTMTPLDIHGPLEQLLTLLKDQFERARVAIAVARDRDTPRIAGNSDQIKQLFLNVLINAIEAMPDGGRLAVRVASPGDLGRPGVVVEFSDTGSGIPPDLLESVFDPFITTKAKGTGLGLSISRGIADAHGATISARNNDPGPGTTIRIEFPVASTRERTT
jgi:signal transduction histidine kinase